MNILIVSQYYWPENFKINIIAENLVDRGHKVTILTGMPNYPEGFFYKDYGIFGPYREFHKGVEIIRTPIVTRGAKRSFRLILNYLSFAIFGSLMALTLLGRKYDSIFVYQTSPVTAVLPALTYKLLKRTPVNLWVLDIWPDTLTALNITKRKYIIRFLDAFVAMVYKYSDLILISSNGFKQCITRYNIDQKKIVYWPQFGESIFLRTPDTPTTKASPKFKGEFNILFAGNLGVAQDLRTVVDAAKILENDQRIKWIFIGDGVEKLPLVQYVKNLNLSDSVHFYDREPIENMPAYFAQADVLLITLADQELFHLTLPAKVSAYLASGRPILAAIGREASQLIQTAEAGITCPPGNSKALAEGIKKMIALTDDERAAIGERGRNYFLSNLYEPILMDKLEKYLDTKSTDQTD